ncbi:GAF domain protein, partial [Vibrio parahaemolyticus V-223/04]
SQRKC